MILITQNSAERTAVRFTGMMIGMQAYSMNIDTLT